MTNSKKLEKSKGVVVFAFNSSTVDYVKIADRTSRLIDANLKLPITLITDKDADPKFNYDHVIKVDSQSGNLRNSAAGNLIEWKNFDRYLAYKFSPYDTTVLLDCDYLVLDDSLLKLLNDNFDYRLMHNSHGPKDMLYQLMGTISPPFVWATVVIFNKSKLSNQYFELVGRIQRNYAYYSTLFNCTGSYRNDYAFAMANIILNGYNLNEHQGIPWSMFTMEDGVKSIEIKNSFLVIRNESSANIVARQNVHVMDKKFLISDIFEDFVNRICDEST
jgi:hypothetical protein